MSQSMSGISTRNVSEGDEIGRLVASSVPYGVNPNIFTAEVPFTRSEGYDEFFDPPLEPKYECPICLLGLRNPLQTQCGHRFCKNCIIRSIRESGPKCPVDNKPLSERELYPDNFAKREMMSFQVLCRLKKERGCPWKGPLSDIENHLKECDYIDVKCPNGCGTTIQMKDVDKHIQENCPKRKALCKHCKHAVFIGEMEMHLTRCPKIKLACEHCKKELQREKMPSHLQNDCPNVKSKCPFAFISGCGFEDFNPAVAKHVSDCHVKHIMDLARYIQNHMSGSPSFTASGPAATAAGQTRPFSPPSGPQEHTPRDSEIIRETSSRSASIQRTVDWLGSRGDEHNQTLAMLDRKVEDMKILYERRLAELTHKLMKVETREIELEGRVCDGTFIWKIDNFRRCREESISGSMAAIHSPPFYTSLYGYKLCLRMNLNGVDTGLGRHVSLFIHMMQGDWDDILEWPFTGRITLAVLDQSENVEFRRPISETLVAKPNLLAFQKPTAPRNHKGYGYVEFCQIDQLREEQYIKNNSLLVRIQVFH